MNDKTEEKKKKMMMIKIESELKIFSGLYENVEL